MQHAEALAEELRRIGQAAGLDAVGICDASPFGETRAIIEDRWRAGLAGGMQFTYRNPARSTDPGSTLAGARSLVVGARSYLRAGPAGATPAPAGRVARYAWVDHYRPLRSALSEVASRLVEEGWRARVMVDDNALVDRAAAVRAGIGYYGKNANVLVPGAGSWFVLGSVATDAPVAGVSLPPVPSACGSCRRCIADCPTGAITAPGEVDARRCLAWLLQAPGVFPRAHRAALGDRLYGCDACQEACPVNLKALRRDPPPPAEGGSRAAVDVLELLAADDETVMREAGRWYVPGREARYVRRNALVVLGNTGRPDDARVVAALERALDDPDPVVRSHGVWAAARLGRRDLVGRLAEDADPLVVAEVAAAAEAVPDRSS